jgi:hypothetical protein
MAAQGPRSRFPSPQTAYEEVRERATRGYHEVEEFIGRNPASSVLAVFGMGLGIGIWIGSSLVEAERRRRAESASFTEKLGRQVLEAISGVMPESFSTRLQR